MCKLNISVKDEYVYLNIKNKTVKYYVPRVLKEYTSCKDFDKETGVVTLVVRVNRMDGTTVLEEDWIDLNGNLCFAFKNPGDVINEIDQIALI